MQPEIAAQHRGTSNFIVQLHGVGDVTGSELLFNEIGTFPGEALPSDELPNGAYLLAVQADGPWTISFRR